MNDLVALDRAHEIVRSIADGFSEKHAGTFYNWQKYTSSILLEYDLDKVWKRDTEWKRYMCDHMSTNLIYCLIGMYGGFRNLHELKQKIRTLINNYDQCVK